MRIINLILLIFLFISSCAKRRVMNTKDVLDSDLSGFDNTIELSLFDPEKATPDVQTDASKMDYYGTNFLLPSVELGYKDHDYVNILRCGEKARQVITEKINKSNLSTTLTALEERKTTWDQLWGSPELCHPAKQNARDAIFIDFSSPKGSFFYVINPCVSADKSTTKMDQCSYRLAMTASVQVLKSLSEEFRSKMAELEAAEAVHDAILGRLVNLQATLARQKSDCEQVYKNSVLKDQNAETMFIAATASVVGAGAVSTRILYRPIANKLPFKIPESIGGFKGKNWIPAMIFASATALIIGVHKAVKQSPDTATTCDKVANTAQKILNLQNSVELKNSELRLNSISKELNALDNQFDGYNIAISGASS